MFTKEKCDGTIKARGCADRRSQQEYTNKADTSSPTVSLEAMLHRCKRRVVCLSDRYARSIPTCRYGTGCPHASRRYYCQAHCKTIQKICMEEQTRQTNAVCN